MESDPGLAARRKRYTALRVIPHLAPESRDPRAASEDGSAPRAQWQVHSAYAAGPRATLNVTLLHVGPLHRFQVPGYTRADVNAEWRLTSGLSASVIGQNLVDASHAEFATVAAFLAATRVPRSVGVRLRWAFR